MIRHNLATRPFYNDSAVRTWLTIAAVAVLALTAVNVQRLIHYSRSDTELATRAANDERRAAELRDEAARLRASVDAAQVQTASADAKEANDLIDRRTFSWTALFNRFEATLPANVRITSLRRTYDPERGPVINVSLVSRSVDDVGEFIEALNQDGTFGDVLPVNEQVDPGTGELMAVLSMTYRPTSAVAAADATPPAPSPSAANPERAGRQ